IHTEASVGMPNVIAKALVLDRIDHCCVGILRRARRVGPRVVKEFTEKARECGEIFSCYGAGFEKDQTTVVQEIAQGRSKRIVERATIKSEAGNDRAERRLQLRNTHSRWEDGFRGEPDSVRRHG